MTKSKLELGMLCHLSPIQKKREPTSFITCSAESRKDLGVFRHLSLVWNTKQGPTIFARTFTFVEDPNVVFLLSFEEISTALLPSYPTKLLQIFK